MKLDDIMQYARSTHKEVTAASEVYIRTLYERALGARCIIEIGIGPECVSGSCFAAAMGEGGWLYSIDLDSSRPTQEQRAFIEAMGVHWDARHGDSMKVVLWKKAPLADLLYIDGDHGHEHVVGDYERFRHFVKPGGVIIFDDVVQVMPSIRQMKLPGEVIIYDHNTQNGFFITSA